MTPAARWRSPATAPAPSGSRPSCARRSTCRCSGSTDIATAKDAVPDLLARFHAVVAGLLLGTQMVAKGDDFPDVTLGVVLYADSTLRFPDFRAEERTFSLIAQLAASPAAGRRADGCWCRPTAPDTPSIEAVARHDSDGFCRRAPALACAALPAVRRPRPRRRLLGVGRASPGGRRAGGRAVGAGVCSARRSSAGAAVPPAGPRGRQLVVKTGEREVAVRAVAAAVEAAARDRALREVAFSVDVDPQ